ncbi:MAG TPA: phage tail sheath subtilisin-like domain-containing protein [Polyangiaceae bacterium]
MVALLHPGVYVQEVPSGIRSIEGVPTSTTIFVGETERGPLEPTKILSAGDYARLFGGYLRHSGTGAVRVAMRYETDLFFQNGGTAAYILRATSDADATTPPAENTAVAHPQTGSPAAGRLVAASPGEWGNHVYAIIQVTDPAPPAVGSHFRIVVYYLAPGGSAPALVEDWDRLSDSPTDPNYVGGVLQRSLYIRWVSAATAPTAGHTLASGTVILELKASEIPATSQFTGAHSDEAVDDDTLNALTLPKLDGIDDAAIIVGATERWANSTTFPEDSGATTTGVRHYYDTIRAYVDRRPKLDLFFVADLPRFAASTGVTDAKNYVAGTPDAAGINGSTFAAVYWPHLVLGDPVGPTSTATITLPPSGAVAGIYAKTDSTRGVFKAPAGVDATVGAIVGLQRSVIDSQQDDLNPIGINVVRPIPGAGTVVWGSRTLRPGSEWRYVPVRRMALFLRKSIFNGIQFAVFEPNDQQLWASLRTTITAFMQAQFRNGAFAGATASVAYFVKVDNETTTPDDQAAGIVNILVGFAPLRPAEFVVVRLSQKTATNT